VHAQSHELHPKEGFGSGHGKEELVETLGLSQEQKEQLECETPQQGRELMQEVMRAKKKLNDLMRDPATPKHEIYSQFDRVQEAIQNFHTHKLEKILLIRDVLRPDQLKTFLSLKQKRENEMKQRWKEGGRGKGKDQSGRN
jgi:Spy/CpxP family protein refolding chaperone